MAAKESQNKYTLSLLEGLKHTPELYEFCRRVDALQDSKSFDESFELLTKPPAELQEHVEVLWRVARAHYDRADQKPTDQKWREEWIKKGFEWAEKALAKDDGNWAAHKWYAVLISQMGAFVPTKQKIQNAFSIKEHATRALELKPKDPATLHMLGRWCYEVAGISWIESKLAATLWAHPPQSTYEEALSYFQQADEEFHWIGNYYYLSLVARALKKNDMEQEYLKALLQLPSESNLDEHYHQLAKSKLKK